MLLLGSFIIAMFITIVMIPPLIHAAAKYNFVDVPNERKVHTGVIPRVGGIAMVCGVILPILFLLQPSDEIVAFLLGICVIIIFGVLDDKYCLSPKIKFIGQTIATLIVVVLGGVIIEYVPFWSSEPLSLYVSLPLTVFALLGITNAVNLADGLDGLAGGTVLISLTGIAFLAFLLDQQLVLFISIAIMGSIFGFLRFNTYPASIFMGDGGSQFLGFSIGVLTIMLIHGAGGVLSPSLALLLLGVPILDTLYVMVKRIREGRSPFSPDKNHFHHKFLALKFSHYEAVFLLYLLQCILVILALLFKYYSDEVIILCYALFCGLIISFFRFQGAYSQVRENLHACTKYIEKSKRLILTNIDEHKLYQYLSVVLVTLVAGFMLITAFQINLINSDVIWVIRFLFVFSLLFYLLPFRNQNMSWYDRAILYFIGAAFVYHTNVSNEINSIVFTASDFYFIVLAIVLIITLPFNNEKRFKFSTLDFLIIFIAISFPVFYREAGESGDLIINFTKLILLYYSIEFLVTQYEVKAKIVRMFTLCVLATLTLNSLI